MAVVVNGKQYVTLSDEFFVNGKKVYAAYANGVQVYPEDTPEDDVYNHNGFSFKAMYPTIYVEKRKNYSSGVIYDDPEWLLGKVGHSAYYNDDVYISVIPAGKTKNRTSNAFLLSRNGNTLYLIVIDYLHAHGDSTYNICTYDGYSYMPFVFLGLKTNNVFNISQMTPAFQISALQGIPESTKQISSTEINEYIEWLLTQNIPTFELSY